MQWKHRSVIFLLLLVVSAVAPVRAQVTHAATEGRLPLTVGSGWSNYSIDWGPGKRMGGITVWADWRLRGMPGLFKGIGISAEGQCICWNVPSNLNGQHKLQAFLGGPSYQFERWERVRPYLKYMIGFGGMYFTVQDPYYTHDTRVIYAPGGGADVHVWNKLAVRGDYEYQFWPNMFPGTSNPNGFTLGTIWDFGFRPPRQ
jgi:Outer membrane protein beta-barrel domain